MIRLTIDERLLDQAREVVDDLVLLHVRPGRNGIGRLQ